MSELDPAKVTAASEAWVLEPPGSQVVQTQDYRLVLLPEPYADPLQLQWVRSARPVAEVLGEVVARAAEFGQAAATVFTGAGSPPGFDEALLARGATLIDTCDVLARPLPPAAPAAPTGLDVRWRTTLDVARDAKRITIEVFGAKPSTDEQLAERVAADSAGVAAGTGGALVAYLDGEPAGTAGVEIVDGVARLWGGAVRERFRGRGVYRAMVAAREAYAAGHGATMAFLYGRVTTSSPILRRLGFGAYGQERVYRLPVK